MGLKAIQSDNSTIYAGTVSLNIHLPTFDCWYYFGVAQCIYAMLVDF